MLILRPLLLAFTLLLAGCQTTSTGFDDHAVRLGAPSEAELKAFTGQVAANAAERGLTSQQAANAFARLGWERLLTRKYDEATSLLNRAWALDPENPTIAAGFALIRHYRDNQPKLARQELVAAINHQPNDPALRMHYGRMFIWHSRSSTGEWVTIARRSTMPVLAMPWVKYPILSGSGLWKTGSPKTADPV